MSKNKETASSKKEMDKRNAAKQAFQKDKGKQNRNPKKQKDNRDKRSEKEKEKEVPKKGKPYQNAFAWYAAHPDLLEPAARVAFPYKPGMHINLGSVSMPPFGEMGPSAAEVFNGNDIPGVCALRFAYTLGYSDNVNSPMSIAALKMYSQLREAYSASLDADGPDLLMYTVGFAQVEAFIYYIRKIYGLINLYSGQNIHLPRTILASMGFSDADIWDLRNHRDVLWGGINNLVHNAMKFAVPDMFPLFDRWDWLTSTVFMDDGTLQAQMYHFVPRFFFSVQNSPARGTWLRPDAFDPALSELSATDYILYFGDQLIRALSESEDAYTINGYFRRVYEKVPLREIPLLEQTYMCVPAYEPAVLEQIENLMIFPVVANSDFAVTQDPATNVLYSRPRADWAEPLIKPHLNLFAAIPTEVDIVEASRLMPAVGANGELYTMTEVITDMQLWNTRGDTHETYMGELHSFETIGISDFVADNIALKGKFDTIANLVHFNRHPAVYLTLQFLDPTGPEPVVGSQILLQEMHNMAPVSMTTLMEINRICMLSLLNCY